MSRHAPDLPTTPAPPPQAFNETTSPSLLERLRATPRSQTAWGEFDVVYRPFLRRWAVRLGTRDADVDDLVQNVIAEVLRYLPKFHHNERAGAFRTWIRTILTNRVRNERRRSFRFWGRVRPLTAELEDASSSLCRLWDADHDKHVFRQVWECLAASARDKEVFLFLVVEGNGAPAAAARFTIPVATVYQIKSRVMQMLRAELQGLIDLD